jgi:O-antigen ligase
MTQINSNIILVLGGGIGILALFFNSNIATFIFIAIFILVLTLFRLSINILFYFLLLIRTSLDIFGQYSIKLLPEFSSINIAGLVATLSIIVSLIIIYKSKQSIFSIPLSLIFILLFCVYILFSGLSNYPIISINELVRVLSFLIMYFTGYIIIQSRLDCINFIKIVIASSIIPTIVGYIQLFNGAGLYTNPGFENRIAGTFGHPNVLGYFLLIIIALLIYLLFEKNLLNNTIKYIFIFYGILLTILLIATYTRGAWIGLFVLLIGVGLIKFPKKTIIYTSVMIPMITILLSTYFLLQQTIWYELTPIEDIPIIARMVGLFNGDPSDSIIWRQVMWSDMYNKALTQPLTGFGTGTIETIVEEVRGVSLGSLEVHNDYIKIFVEMGLFGLVTYILFIISILYSLAIRIHSKQDTFLLIVTFITIAIYLSSIWDNLLRQTAVMWIFFGLLGVAFKYYTIYSKQTPEVSSTEE